MLGVVSIWAVKAHLMSLEGSKADYFAARIAREIEIRDAISESCMEWIVGTRMIPADFEQGFFFWDRFYYAHAFGYWLREQGFRLREKTAPNVLAWLLVDCWSEVHVYRWKSDLASGGTPSLLD